MRSGALAGSESKRRLHKAASKLSHQDLPKCSACQFGRQTSRPVPGKVTSIVKDRSGILSADKTHPGQLMFIDHFVCTTRGRTFKGYGIKSSSSTTRRAPESYRGGCIFVDASTRFVHVEFQCHLNAYETLQAVENFERVLETMGSSWQNANLMTGLHSQAKPSRKNSLEKIKLLNIHLQEVIIRMGRLSKALEP